MIRGNPLKRSSLLLLIVILNWASPVFADIYNCNGKFQNKPCGDGGKVVFNEPPVELETRPSIYLPFDGNVTDLGRHRFKEKSDPGIVNSGFEESPHGKAIVTSGNGPALLLDIIVPLNLQEGGTLLLWGKLTGKQPSGAPYIAGLDGFSLGMQSYTENGKTTYALNGQVGWLKDTTSVVCSHTKYPIDPDKWYHFAISHDTSSALTKLYINGELVAEKQGAVKFPFKSVSPLKVGSYFKTSQAFKGSVDEVKFYTKSLSAEEVKAIYGGKEVAASSEDSVVVGLTSLLDKELSDQPDTFSCKFREMVKEKGRDHLRFSCQNSSIKDIKYLNAYFAFFDPAGNRVWVTNVGPSQIKRGQERDLTLSPSLGDWHKLEYTNRGEFHLFSVTFGDGEVRDYSK